jgi:hypothetical protein
MLNMKKRRWCGATLCRELTECRFGLDAVI